MTIKNATTTRVIEILQNQGEYVLQPRLLQVEEVDFEFDAILRGPSGSEGLVVLAEQEAASIPLILSRIRALSRLMIRSGSIRPLTLVLIEKGEQKSIARELSTVCRVVSVKSGSSEEVLKQLRSLLRLELPSPAISQGDPLQALRNALGARVSDELISRLISASRRSSEDVHGELVRALELTIEEALTKEESI